MPLTATIAEQLRAKARIAPLPRRMRRAMTRASSTSPLAVQPLWTMRLTDPGSPVYRRIRDSGGFPFATIVAFPFSAYYSDGSPAPAAIVDDLKPQE